MKYNILNKSRFGFQRNKSTKNAITIIIENIIESLNTKIKCNFVLLDLSKAFDCVEHNTLLDKLYQYGVCGIPHTPIKSYITSKTQQAKVTHIEKNQLKEYLSNRLPVIYGIPLGPLLFILYVNGVPHLTQGRSIMYAGDTPVLSIKQDLNEFQKTSENTGLVEQYFETNNLSINPTMN
jgi:hypothetical protein